MLKQLLLAAVGACAVLAPAAYGEMIQIQYQVTGSSPVTCSTALPGPVSCPNTGVPLAITNLDANSNSPGTSTMADLDSSALSLFNTSGASETIQIQVSANDFTAPAGSSLTLLSHIGGTVLIGGTGNSISFQSCIDPSNSLRSVGSLGVACPAGATASGLSAPSITAAGSFDNSQSATVASVSGSYALSESYVITLAAGAQINWSASTTLQGAATPEPDSMALAGLGLLGLSLVLKRVRRQA